MTPVPNEREVILQILRGIEDAKPVGEHRREMWERCWSENAETPYFGGVVRQFGKFYTDPTFERQFLNGLLRMLGQSYFLGGQVSEFGCGLGENLRGLKDFFGVDVIGYDWSEAAVERVREVGIDAEAYDMFNPRPVAIDMALTVHAMEQLGTRWAAFLDMLIAARPRVCVHIEPIVELYDQNKLLDYLAILYHEKRGYLSGFLPGLKQRAADGQIEILEVTRSHVGSLFHEAYSVIVWRTK